MDFTINLSQNPKIKIDSSGLVEFEALVLKACDMNYEGIPLSFSKESLIESIQTARGKPLIAHTHKTVTPEVYRELAIGSIADAFWRENESPLEDGLYFKGVLGDKDAQIELNQTKNKNVSAGFKADVSENGEVTSINFNHLAILLDNPPRIEGAQINMSEKNKTKEEKRRRVNMGNVYKGLQMRFAEENPEILEEEIKEAIDAAKEVEEIVDKVEDPSLLAQLNAVLMSIQEMINSLIKKDKEIAEETATEEDLMMSHQAGLDGVVVKTSRGKNFKNALREAQESLWQQRAKELSKEMDFSFSEGTSVEEVKGAWKYRESLKGKSKVAHSQDFNLSEERSITAPSNFYTTNRKIQVIRKW